MFASEKIIELGFQLLALSSWTVYQKYSAFSSLSCFYVRERRGGTEKKVFAAFDSENIITEERF